MNAVSDPKASFSATPGSTSARTNGRERRLRRPARLESRDPS